MDKLLHHLARITQSVALTDQPDAQVNVVVESISSAMGADVCTLYLRAADGAMQMLASHGLAAESVATTRLPPGEGLVGLVARGRHPINIADAAAHEQYYFVAETGEEQFLSFCGVPLVARGRVIGVLVVQSREHRLLTAEDEGFLVTLSSHLALVLESNPLLSSSTAVNTGDRAKGIKGAPGVGIGRVRLSDHGELYAVVDNPSHDIESDLEDWRALVKTVREELEQEQSAVEGELSGSVASIFSAYRMILEDPAFTTYVEECIAEGNWLPGALRKATRHFSELFLSIEDPYMKARNEDVHHLGNKLFNAWRGVKPATLPVDSPVVLVGAQVSVSDIAAVPADKLAGIICLEGSGLSHTAVLANALGVPAVMGTGVVRGLEDNAQIIVDGNVGQVVLNPGPTVLTEFTRLAEDRSSLLRRLEKIQELPATTTDFTEMTLYTNTGLLADISPGLRNGAQGVGLYRTEIPFMIHHTFPSEDEQAATYRQVLEAYEGKPVHMRTLDIGGDKQLPYFPIDNESNPALGWRGIRFTLDNSALQMTQVRAMLRAAESLGNLRILLPMISSSGELDDFRQLLEDALVQLREEGHDVARPDVGVMIEVPAAISQIPYWAERIDFLSIGSNDLSQYLLALDRDNPRVANRYDHIHPAVLLEIQRIVRLSSAHNIPLSLCGEMASDVVAVVLLMGLGVRTVSMSARRLPHIKWLIRNISLAESEQLVAEALALGDAVGVRELVRGALERKGLGELFS